MIQPDMRSGERMTVKVYRKVRRNDPLRQFAVPVCIECMGPGSQIFPGARGEANCRLVEGHRLISLPVCNKRLVPIHNYIKAAPFPGPRRINPPDSAGKARP